MREKMANTKTLQHFIVRSSALKLYRDFYRASRRLENRRLFFPERFFAEFDVVDISLLGTGQKQQKS